MLPRSMLHRSKLLATLVGLLLLTGAVLGCGSSDDDSTSESENPEALAAQEAETERASKIKTRIDAADVVRAFPPQIVKDGDVAAEDEGSPERALLEWWQAVQFNDAKKAQSLTSEAVLEALGEDEFATWAGTNSLPGVAILDTSQSGRQAVVNVGILSFQADESGEVPDEPTNSTPDTFTMRREGGSWVYDQLDFLVPKVEALQN